MSCLEVRGRGAWARVKVGRSIGVGVGSFGVDWGDFSGAGESWGSGVEATGGRAGTERSENGEATVKSDMRPSLLDHVHHI